MKRIAILPVLTFCILLCLASDIIAQDRCGTTEYELIRHSKSVKMESESQFEQWMQSKIAQNKLQTIKPYGVQAMSYVIPVVVHVIHNGEAVGTGTNISDAQILSNIQVINDDFKRLNADRVNTPPEFSPVATSIDITFVLAKQDPEGLATNGITRTLGTKTSWTVCDNAEVKGLSYWPAENYLNIWIVNLTGYIGYAQLPISGTLPGLDNPSQDRLTDGVLINYKDFGTIDGGSFVLDPQYNKGRTATHEIGHIFGLRHIWGDGNCATDYVPDTPSQTGPTSGCPSNPQNSCAGPSAPHKMFQNYMDYSNDACMNIYTQGQVDRMVVVLANSPRRASLTTSPGATDPIPVANDLGIRRIITPSSAECRNPVTPQIEVRNYGTNSVTSAQVQILLNGSGFETKTFPISLSPNQLATLSFDNNFNFSQGSTQQVSFQILQTNGMTDGNTSNNSASVNVKVPLSISVPVVEPFNSLPSGWTINNQDGDLTWANVSAPDNNPSNKAMYMNFYSYINCGSADWLISPSFGVTTPLSTQLRFDIAYANSSPSDGLKVYALPGCNPDLSQAILLYNKSGSALSTASASGPFVPNSDGQWRKSEVVSLSTLTSTANWSLAFISNNGNGNNLYVDNVVINDQVVNDIGLMAVESPGIVQCQSTPNIQIRVKNFSTSNIISFQVQRKVNGGSFVSQSFNNIMLAVGDEKSFTLSPAPLNDGVNQVVLNVELPNGLPDTAPANNSITFNTTVDRSKDETPLREDFDSSSNVPWLATSSPNALLWEEATTNKNQSIVYRAYTNPSLSDESWLVSPVLDMSRYAAQSLFFDLSYSQKVPANDRLRILASEDCGVTYKTLLFDKLGNEFSIGQTTAPWVPTTSSDWTRQYVLLDTVAGKKNIRLAFVATNANGNNIYIDNIEIFAGDDPHPPVTSALYQLYYSTKNTQSDLALTFNLPQRKDVRLQIFSVMGQVIADNILPDTLNQTYYFDLSLQATGIYIFRIQIENQYSATRVFIGH